MLCDALSNFDAPAYPFHRSLFGATFPAVFREHVVEVGFPVLNTSEHSRYGGRTSKKTGRTRWTSFYMDSFNIRVQLPEPISVPDEILRAHWRDRQKAGASATRQIDAALKRGHDLAAEFFDRFSRHLRLELRAAVIGAKFAPQSSTIRNSVLLQRGTSAPLSSTHVAMNVYMHSRVIDRMCVKRVLRRVATLKLPPVYFEYFFDGQLHLRSGDYERTVPDFAIAAETLLRSGIIAVLPTALDPEFVRYIDTASIQGKPLEKWAKIAFGSEWEGFKHTSTLHKLFARRNEVAHGGRSDSLTADECRAFQRAVGPCWIWWDRNQATMVSASHVRRAT